MPWRSGGIRGRRNPSASPGLLRRILRSRLSTHGVTRSCQRPTAVVRPRLRRGRECGRDRPRANPGRGAGRSGGSPTSAEEGNIWLLYRDPYKYASCPLPLPSFWQASGWPEVPGNTPSLIGLALSEQRCHERHQGRARVGLRSDQMARVVHRHGQDDRPASRF